MTKKRIAILGSTGTIGINTLKVCRQLSDELEVVGLAVHSNIQLLIEQIKEFKPRCVSVMDPDKSGELQRLLKQESIPMEDISFGMEGLVKIATLPDVDMVVIATVGAIGLLPTLEAIDAGKQIALANKEVLVMAGELVMDSARKHNVPILPIDSEHNAIYQCLMGQSSENIHKILLTGSGGPFRKHMESFEKITPEQALKHPTWNMGRKITIDSSTLMNKSLELIEATHLFDIPAQKIEVVIHPQSIIHSMVEFIDGSIIAQMGVTDMYLPIQFSLTYPHRRKAPKHYLDLHSIQQLTFEKPDINRFPCLRLGYEAISIGGTMPTVMNAANEMAVHAFLEKKISFPQLPELIEATMQAHTVIAHPDLNQILQADIWGRNQALTLIEQKYP
jgi:1-deoxy-D-xylulose-5-phosphate reductoisomerase